MATISVVKLKVRRGPDNQRRLITLDSGELGFVTDPSAHRLFVGDGVVKGGISAGMKFFYGSITSPTSLIYTQVGDIVYNTDDTRLYVLTGINSENFPDYSNRQAYQFIGPATDSRTLTYNGAGKLVINTTGISAVHVSTDVFDLTRGFARPSDTSKVRVDLNTIDASVLPTSNPGPGKLWSSGGYVVAGNITGGGFGSVTNVTGTAPITVANGTTTPAISLGIIPSNLGGAGTVNGVLKANGAGTVTAAVAGTDYVIPSGSITGNAATATKLATARTINGVSFDGTTDITIPTGGGGSVTSVTGTAPITVTNGTTTPAISLGIIPSNLGGAGTVNGLLKANGAGLVTAAVAGTDFAAPGSSIPTGAVTYYSLPSAPAGWVECNGAAITVAMGASFTALRNLLLGASSPFGVSGSDPLLPDLRGRFIRSFGTDSTVSPTVSSGAFGTKQADAFQGHAHSAAFGGSMAVTGGGPNGCLVPGSSPTGAPVVEGANGTPRTAVETRPANLALLACIKL